LQIPHQKKDCLMNKTITVQHHGDKWYVENS
jgi:hypothetical protein